MVLLMGSVVSRRLRGWPKEAAWDVKKTIGVFFGKLWLDAHRLRYANIY